MFAQAHVMVRTRRYGVVKRGIDIAVALTTLVPAVPFLLVAAMAIKLTSAGPTLYRQRRLGRGGRIFTVYKLRTMTDRPLSATEIYVGHREVTRIGTFLRRFKLDELPQLVNILRGDMSLVGPRPALPQQITDYSPLAMRRLEVRPGLTGLAQVSGNIYLSWPERWAYDARYVDELSLWLDLRIVLKTVAVVLAGEHLFARKQPNARP